MALDLGLTTTVISIENTISNARWEIGGIVKPSGKELCVAKIYGGNLRCSKRAIDGGYCGTHIKIHN